MWATGLRIGSSGSTSTGGAAVTSVGAIDGLTTWSAAVWFRIRGGSSTLNLIGKGAAASNNRRITIAVGSDRAVQVSADRATTDLAYFSPAGVIETNRAYGILVTMNTAGAAGQLVRVYLATPDRFLGAIPMATATDGTGAFNSDAAVNLVIGNNTTGALPVMGDIYAAWLSNVELSAAEAEMLLQMPRSVPRGLLGRWDFDRTNGVTVYDRSGNGRHATISGSGMTLTTKSWSNARRPSWIQLGAAANRTRLSLLGVQ